MLNILTQDKFFDTYLAKPPLLIELDRPIEIVHWNIDLPDLYQTFEGCSAINHCHGAPTLPQEDG